jgi:hypothetical protein
MVMNSKTFFFFSFVFYIWTFSSNEPNFVAAGVAVGLLHSLLFTSVYIQGLQSWLASFWMSQLNLLWHIVYLLWRLTAEFTQS